MRSRAVCDIAVTATSCSPQRPAVSPRVTPPAQFSPSGTEQVSDRWWQSLGDTTLNGLIERALSGNLTLRGTWDRLSQAEATARRDGAGVYPNASLSSGAKVTQEHSGNAATDGRSTDLSLGVAASYEIDLWGRVRASRDAANLDARSMGEDVRTAAVTLSAQVATTWYGLVRQRGEIAILQRQLRSNEEMLELVMLRFHQGQSKAEDVLRQRQIVEARRGDIARAQANSSVLQHRLAILLGQNPSVEVAQPSTNLAALPPLPSTGVPAELIQRRPDTRRAYFDVLAADRRVAAAVADRFPRLSITAEAATSGGAVTDLFSNWLASLAGNLTMPLVDGGRRIAEVERARAATSASLSNYGQVVLNALGEVEDALITEQRQAEYVASLAQQLSLAGSVIERSRDNYLQGVTEYTRVLDAQQTHQALEITYLGARATQIENRIALYRALSGGWAMTHPETSSSAN